MAHALADIVTELGSNPSGSSATVQARILAIEAGGSTALLKSGGTMAGAINMGTNRITNLPSPAAGNDAVPRDWANATYVGQGGDTMTGILNMTGHKITNVQLPSDDGDAANMEYVDHRVKKEGDSMSGPLDMTGHRIHNVPAPADDGDAANLEYVGHRILNTGDSVTGVYVTSDGRWQAGANVLPATDGSAGAQVRQDGYIGSAAGDDMTNSANVVLKRQGTGGSQLADQPFVAFRRVSSTPQTIGTITINGASSVAYNTSSDHRLKENLGPITDALSRVRQLASVAFRGQWTEDQGGGQEWDMLYAHDTATAAPYAVTGVKDAVDADGNIVPQQTGYSTLVPLLIAAIGELADQVAALQAAS